MDRSAHTVHLAASRVPIIRVTFGGRKSCEKWMGVNEMLKDLSGPDLSGPLSAADLLQMGYVDDPMLLEDVSLCTVCSVTCASTAAEQPTLPTE